MNRVVFDSNTGSGGMGVQQSPVAATLNLNAFTKTGYHFLGWSTSNVATTPTYLNGASFPFSAATTTLYAVWAQNSSVTFDANQGTGTMPTQSSASAANLSANVFSRAGYEFGGWALSNSSTTVAYANQASYPFTSSTTLYAIWTPNRVTFNNNSGSGTMAPQLSPTAAALTPNSFWRTGYSFLGWAPSNSATTPSYIDGASYSFASSTTLFAVWARDFTVTFNANGGSGSMSDQSHHLSRPLTTNTLARPGYTFTGWNTLASGLGTAYSDAATYTFTADVTLYAQWVALPQTSTASVAAPAETLAHTGASFAPAGAAIALLLAGAILVLRRRRPTSE